MSRYFCHENPDTLTLGTVVVDARPGRARLATTPFYPGGGGQLADRGVLKWTSGEVPVAGFDQAEGHLWHLLARPVEIAGPVELAVDPGFRRLMRELHTDLHIINALAFQGFDGALVTGAQMNDDGTARIDLDLPGADNDRLRALEPAINEAILRDLPVTDTYVPLEAAREEKGLLRSRSVTPPPTAWCGSSRSPASTARPAAGPIWPRPADRARRRQSCGIVRRGDHPVGAAPGAGEDVIGPLDRAVAEQRPKDRQLRSAEALTGARRRADRAVVLDQHEAAVLRPLDLGHVALGPAELGQSPQPPGERTGAIERSAVAGERVGLAERDQPVEPLGPKQPADGADQLDRDLGMGVGKSGLGLVGQPPVALRPTDAASLVREGDQAVLLEPRQMLAHAHGGDAKVAAEVGSGQRRPCLQQEQDALGGAFGHGIGGSMRRPI